MIETYHPNDEISVILKEAVGNLPNKKTATDKMISSNANLNLCSIFVNEVGSNGDWVEYPGVSSTTKYYVNSQGKTSCIPKLAFGIPPDSDAVYDEMDDSFSSSTCSGKVRFETCIGEIIVNNSDIANLEKPDGTSPTKETPISDLVQNNTFDCSLFGGCTVKPGIPPLCTDFSGKNTIFKKITKESLFIEDEIDPTNDDDFTPEPDIIGSGVNKYATCPAGYRASVTWTYDEIAFLDPETTTSSDENEKAHVLKKNCTFCEKVLYGASVRDFYGESNIAVDNRLDIDNSKTGEVQRTHNEAANYYLSQPDTLGLGEAESNKFVWHVDPTATIDESIALCPTKESCVNPYTYKIIDSSNPLPRLSDFYLSLIGANVDEGLLNNKKPQGLCPVGMIEATGKNGKYITCVPYISNSFPVLCNIDKKYWAGYNQNMLVDKDGNKSAYGAVQRLGCSSGNVLKKSPADRSLICSASEIPKEDYECRPGYGLQPVNIPAGQKVNGKCNGGLGPNCIAGIVFRCAKWNTIISDYIPQATCIDTLTDYQNAGASGLNINICKYGEATTLSIKFTNQSNTSTEDIAHQCRTDVDSKSIYDEFGKRILYNRATAIILVGDCKICL